MKKKLQGMLSLMPGVGKTGRTAGLLSLFLATSISLGCAQSTEQFVLKGAMKDYDGKMIYLTYGHKADGTYRIDSTAVSNGQFKFTGAIDQPFAATLTSGPAPERDPFNLFIERGEMVLNGSWSDKADYTLTGSKTNDEVIALHKQTLPLRKQEDNVSGTVTRETPNEERVIVRAKIQELRDRVNDMEKGYIFANPSSYYSAAMLREKAYDMPLPEARKYYDGLDAKMRGTHDGKYLQEHIAIREAIESGMPAPEVSGTDLNGKDFRMSSLRGKYILLDFWGSWCGPCRRSNPHMVEIYDKYHDKGLEFVYVAFDDGEEEKWHGTIKQDKLERFHHVLCRFETPDDQAKPYNVKTIPCKYLIDRDGRMIGKFDGGELDNKLVEIFGF